MYIEFMIKKILSKVLKKKAFLIKKHPTYLDNCVYWVRGKQYSVFGGMGFIDNRLMISASVGELPSSVLIKRFSFVYSDIVKDEERKISPFNPTDYIRKIAITKFAKEEE